MQGFSLFPSVLTQPVPLAVVDEEGGNGGGGRNAVKDWLSRSSTPM